MATFSAVAWLVAAQTAVARDNQITVLEKSGKVEAALAGTNAWSAARTNQTLRIADRIRTGERSRAALHLLDQSTLRMAELTEFLVEPIEDLPDKPSFSLSKGLLYFFHRDKPAEVQFKTRTATAAIRGTEFHIAVADNGRTVLTMFDGEVELTNAFGAIQLRNGEQGVVEPGQPPVKSPVIDAINVIQWCLYYPGVLDVDELRFDASEQAALQDSIAAYRSGDLLAALTAYPEDRSPVSESEKTYYAALLLSVGKVDQAELLLPTSGNTAIALRELIAAVKHLSPTNALPLSAESSTAALARSYRFQSQSRLPEALRMAEQAVALSPNFGFGWARVAELEFSFGHTKSALAALDKSLALAPSNAQAVALRGFALAAQNKIREATTEFNRAIALDGALGNAWLGRGLCRIRRGDVSGGRDDLQVAATLEPQRALLRSYLAKAWTERGDTKRAEQELALAKERDSNDPTAWLYSALLLQQNNRINEAVEELEHSQALNDNRRVYRSRLMLDQDRAVRGANLANIYRDAGMTDVGVREAATAVNADYANFSAHQFLADSYFAQRDLTGVNLRYETPFVSEYLVASLLAPVGAGPLSPQISQQEYSRLFERNGFRFSSATEYFSKGDWRETAAQEFVSGNTSFALDEYYSSQNGQRPNNDQEVTEFSLRWKQQLTPADSLFVQVTRAESKGGNLAQYYNQSDAANDPFRFKDKQEPVLIAGYHHEWSPGSHTLLLASRLVDDYSVTNPLQTTFNVFKDTVDTLGVSAFQVNQGYRSELEIYTAEAQHIWQTPSFTTVIGTRWQEGTFGQQNEQINFDVGNIDLFPDPLIASQDQSARFNRLTGYAYEQWQATDSLRVIGGLAVERLVVPENHRFAPLTADTKRSNHLLPKAGVIWTSRNDTTVRLGYSESVGGVSFDQSFQLEPTQVAGFNQAFRSLIPESVSGANSGAEFTSTGFSIEHRLPSHTFIALSGELLQSEVNRGLGAFEFVDSGGGFVGNGFTTLHERLKFEESSLSLSLHQLLGKEWAVGATYRVSRANLKDNFTDVTDTIATAGFLPHTFVTSTLQSLDTHVIYQTADGLFARVNAALLHQRNEDYEPARSTEEFVHVDVMAGYRLFHRHAAITVGVLNLTDQDYQLSPLNLTFERYRSRTFFARFSIQF